MAIRDGKGHNQIYHDSPSLKLRTRRRAEWIAKTLAPTDPSTCLELGCGYGDLSAMLAKSFPLARIVSIDLEQRFIEEAQRKHRAISNVEFRVDNFWHLSGEKRYDLIFGNGLLHHYYGEKEKLIEKIKSLLNPQGRICFWEPNPYNPFLYLIFNIEFLRRLTHLDKDEFPFRKKELKELLEKNAFSNIKISYKDFLIPHTPHLFISCLVSLGKVLESNGLTEKLAQSLFIEAQIC